MYGDSLKEQCMEIHIQDTSYGDSYIGYNVWRLIYRVQ